jgi:signal transduction histidine kinase
MTTNILFAHNHQSSEITHHYEYDRVMHIIAHFARAASTRSEASELYREFLSVVQTLVYCEQAVLYQYQENTAMLSPVACWSRTTGVVNVLAGQDVSSNISRSAYGTANSQHETTMFDGESVFSASMPDPVDLANIPPLVISTALHRHTFLHRFTPADQHEPVAELTLPLEAQNVLSGVLLLRRSAAFSGKDTRRLRDICAIAATSWLVITYQKLMSESEKVQERIQQRETQILSLLTHELRSPLNSIHGYLDLALMGVAGDLNVQQHEFVQRARVASQHLYALLEDLLCTARVDAGQLRLHRTIISLPNIIDNVIEELAFTAADHSIELRIDIEPQLPHLYADATRMQQILRNLINNAIKFTPEGGIVKIMAYIEKAPLPDLTYASSTHEDVDVIACLRVNDTGIGIAPEFQQRIFERFYRVLDKNAPQSGGQGLGLSVIKQLVELHGGTVTVESVVGQGSTFTCLIPGLLS